MPAREPIVVLGVGARTPVGFTAPASAAAVRAGISVIQDHPYMIDRYGEAMKTTRDAGVEVRVQGPARGIELGLDAAREALAALPARPPMPVSILLATGEPRPGQAEGHAEAVYAGVRARLAERVEVGRGGVIAGGHAGGLVAMLRARDALAAGQAQLCLVGGVDSYLDPETLEWLDDNEQLHSESNIYGFCPGEGAGFCLLATLARPAPCAAGRCSNSSPSPRRAKRTGIRTETVCLGDRPRRRLPPRLRGSPGDDRPGRPHHLRHERRALSRQRVRLRGAAQLRPLPRRRRLRDAGRLLGRRRRRLRPALRRPCHRGGSARLCPGPLSLVWASSENGSRAAALLRGPGRAG